jgi:hypothetical protein
VESIPDNDRNVVLTGLPRSGTTLACHLLNKLPNTIALSDAIGGDLAGLMPDREAFADGVEEFFRQMRRAALEEGEVISRRLKGVVPADIFGYREEGESLRSMLASRGRMPVGKKLEPGFFLIVKNTVPFAAVLPELMRRFPCYALVRNPLAVLASWNSVNAYMRDGYHPAIEPFDPHFSQELKALRNRHDRQIWYLDWYFSRFERHLPRANVVRYEEIVASGGAALSGIIPAASSLSEPLESNNANPLYDRSEMAQLAGRLLNTEGAYWRVYDRTEVEALVEAVQ